MVNLIELPINAIEAAEETPFLANYFPNIFAEALVPLNPQRWPAYLAGSAMASDMPEFGDKVATPFTNLLTAKEYLETSQSDVHWRDIQARIRPRGLEQKGALLDWLWLASVA